ncbi:MAG: hypothetical protein WB440_04655 [Steroidobacteraceae bacterium]|jgi:hypothetical protein
MSGSDTDMDSQLSALEAEWGLAYEDGMRARADYQSLAGGRRATAEVLDAARERLDRAEALKAHIMTKIERLEYSILSLD